jgi:hypothetical protein
MTLYGTYLLPFGRNQMLLGKANTLVNQIVGGWQFSPVVTYSSGLPFTLSDSECGQQVPGSAPCYPNGSSGGLKTGVSGFAGGGLTFYKSVLPGGVSANNTINICNTPSGGFTCPALDQIGNIGRNTGWGPHFFNADLSLQKNFPIRESILAQFRIDAFNGFNHINFGNPGGNVEQTGSITSGPGPGGTTSPRQLQFSFRVQF